MLFGNQIIKMSLKFNELIIRVNDPLQAKIFQILVPEISARCYLQMKNLKVSSKFEQKDYVNE